MLLAEKKSLIQFVSVFVGLNTVFLVTLSMLYYHYQKNIYTEMLQNEIINYAETAYESIYYANDVSKLDEFLLHDSRFDIAIMDKNYNVIYSNQNDFTIKFKKGFSSDNRYYYYIKTIELDQIKTVHYLAIRANTIKEKLNTTKNIIKVALLLSILFFSIMIFILSRLFLRPLREYIELLNKFISDAIHELNTPISVLSMSLERMDLTELDSKNIKSTDRMLIAVRTLSHLYNDLTFIMFSAEDYPVQKIRLSELILQRIEYFTPIASAKNISFIKELQEYEIVINERLMNRIIDNLFSNAIKYNKLNGTIEVTLDKNSLTITDSGVGFDQSKSEEIFKRYKRLDRSNGGFGLGLSIVKTLCELYEIKIEVNSKEGVGTTFILSWSNSRIIHA